jgi:hypothetical protein
VITPDALHTAGVEQEICRQTAKNFLANPGIDAHPLDFRLYNGVNNTARSLVRLPDGSLVVGGDFTLAGSTTTLHVARWDPALQEWYAMGGGLADPVYEMVAVPGGAIYAITSVPKLYRWTGKDWERIPGPFTDEPASDRSVEAMVWDGKDGFYLGGKFTAAGGLAVNGLVHWDGKIWKALDGTLPVPGIFSAKALARGPDGRLYAGGVLSANPDEQSYRVFAWDGRNWTEPGIPLAGPVEALAVSTTNQLAVVVARENYDPGSDQAWKWSSFNFDSSIQQWVRIPSGFPSIAESFQNPTGKGAGTKSDLDPAIINFPGSEIAGWEGSSWQMRNAPDGWGYHHEIILHLIVSDGKVYILGTFAYMGGVAADNIAVWDASAWHSLSGSPGKPVGGIAGQVNAMVVDQQGILTVAGKFNVAGDVQANNIARWDGKTWHALGLGTNDEILTLAVSPNGQIYAGGRFTQAGGKPTGFLAEWDPVTGEWISIAGEPRKPLFNGVSALTVAPDGVLYAAGVDVDAFGTNYVVAAWDGHQWKNLAGLFNGEVMVPHTDSHGNLYAGGIFTGRSTDIEQAVSQTYWETHKGIPAHALAFWDDKAGTWKNLGMSLGWDFPYNYVSQILDGPDGSLYVGGDFRTANSKPLCNIARVIVSRDTIDWKPLAGGLPSLSRMALSPDGRLIAMSLLPRENGEADPQAVELTSNQAAWQLLGGKFGQIQTYTTITALAISPNNLLYIGGVFSQADGQPARSFFVYQLPQK